jgi:hypothetical protein
VRYTIPRLIRGMWASGSNIAAPASDTPLEEAEWLGSMPDAALDGSHEPQPAKATGLTILDATDAN